MYQVWNSFHEICFSCGGGGGFVCFFFSSVAGESNKTEARTCVCMYPVCLSTCCCFFLFFLFYFYF